MYKISKMKKVKKEKGYGAVRGEQWRRMIKCTKIYLGFLLMRHNENNIFKKDSKKNRRHEGEVK